MERLIQRSADLCVPPREELIETGMYVGDRASHVWRVALPETITQGTVRAYATRCDGVSILIEGTLSGGSAEAVFPDAVCAVAGQVRAVMRLETEEGALVLDAFRTRVYPVCTDAVADPEETVVSLTELLGRIGELEARDTVRIGGTEYALRVSDEDEGTEGTLTLVPEEDT